MQKNEIQSLCVYIVTCLHVFVSYRWSPRAHWDEQNWDWHCTDLPPAVISPSSYQTNLICFLPPGDLQNDLVYDFASSVTSGIFFFFSPTAYLLHQLSQATGGTTDQEDTCDLTLSLTVTTSMPLKVRLRATVTSVCWPTQSLDCNDPSLRNFKHSIARKAAMHSQ